MVITLFRDFILHSQKKFAELKGDAQKEVIVISVAKVGACIATVTQLLTDNKFRCRTHQKPYTYHPYKSFSVAINQLLAIIGYLGKFCEPDDPKGI